MSDTDADNDGKGAQESGAGGSTSSALSEAMLSEDDDDCDNGADGAFTTVRTRSTTTPVTSPVQAGAPTGRSPASANKRKYQDLNAKLVNAIKDKRKAAPATRLANA